MPVPAEAKVISIRGRDITYGAQGQRLITGVSNELCGSRHIAGAFGMVPPGATAKPHLHERSESIILVVEGWAATPTGPNLEGVLFHGPGDFLYVPPGLVHSSINLSRTDRIVFFEMRSETVFNEDIVLLPELTGRMAAVTADLQDKFAAGTLPLPEGWRDQVGKPFFYDAAVSPASPAAPSA